MSTASEDNVIDSKETSAKFHRYFQSETSSIQSRIDLLGSTSQAGGERVDAIDHILASIARLSSEVKDASAYLPAYDQRQYADSLKTLSSHLSTTRAALAPKLKFAFRSSMKRPSAMSLSDAEVLPSKIQSDSSGTPSASGSYAASPVRGGSPSPVPGTGLVGNGGQENGKREEEEEVDGEVVTATEIRGLRGVYKTIPPSLFSSPSTSASNNSTTTTTTLTISRLTHSALNLAPSSHTFTSITLHSISSSLIICSPIDGPIHITNMTNSVLLIPRARQFRMHRSRDVCVYLGVGSRPVIEDCEGLAFAPARGPGGGGGGADGEEEGDGEEVTLWDQIDDFNWLRREKNPHWRVLEEGERVEKDIWDVLGKYTEDTGDPDLSEILTVAGIKQV